MNANRELERPYIIVHRDYEMLRFGAGANHWDQDLPRGDNISAYQVDSVEDLLTLHPKYQGINTRLLAIVPSVGPRAKGNLSILCRLYAQQMNVASIRMPGGEVILPEVVPESR